MKTHSAASLCLILLICAPLLAWSPKVPPRFLHETYPNTKLTTRTVGGVRNGPVPDSKLAQRMVFGLARIHKDYNPRVTFVEGFLFRDAASAIAFRDYQAQRQGERLTAQDFQNLSYLWAKTLAYCSLTKRTKTTSRPELAPNTWWHTLPNLR